jgi:hypothetical protein
VSVAPAGERLAFASVDLIRELIPGLAAIPCCFWCEPPTNLDMPMLL